jgi:hypothetical protein
MSTDIVTLSIKLDKEFHKKIKLYAVEKGVTIKELFIRHMKELLAEEENAKK